METVECNIHLHGTGEREEAVMRVPGIDRMSASLNGENSPKCDVAAIFYGPRRPYDFFFEGRGFPVPAEPLVSATGPRFSF